MICFSIHKLFSTYYRSHDRSEYKNFIEWVRASGGATADDYGHDSVEFSDEDWIIFRLKYDCKNMGS